MIKKAQKFSFNAPKLFNGLEILRFKIFENEAEGLGMTSLPGI